ncbi:hypothetical protein ILUMI_23653 [Ignelater luminosus]|uniref:Uncharacterized protein n=1 Tax=Ignelater luminosus TaxID=2038154 RepID=A0A8K0CE69_IGNLU|nr:hypothetical protein ILUMI_23653 [Ignelater luminosus]
MPRDYIRKTGRPAIDENRKDWLWGFMKRHTDLLLRKPESTSLSRSMAFNKPNLDETGITTVIRPIKIVSVKGTKQVGQIASSERGTLVTFVRLVNAIGTSLPPIFVYPRIRNPSEYLSEGSPTGSIALGLWPLDRLIFTESDFAASSVTDKPLDIDEQKTASRGGWSTVRHVPLEIAGKEWTFGFIKRHPRLGLRNPEASLILSIGTYNCSVSQKGKLRRRAASKSAQLQVLREASLSQPAILSVHEAMLFPLIWYFLESTLRSTCLEEHQEAPSA